MLNIQDFRAWPARSSISEPIAAGESGVRRHSEAATALWLRLPPPGFAWGTEDSRLFPVRKKNGAPCPKCQSGVALGFATALHEGRGLSLRGTGAFKERAILEVHPVAPV